MKRKLIIAVLSFIASFPCAAGFLGDVATDAWTLAKWNGKTLSVALGHTDEAFNKCLSGAGKMTVKMEVRNEGLVEGSRLILTPAPEDAQRVGRCAAK